MMLNLLRLLAVLRARWIVGVLVAVVVAAWGVGYALTRPQIYVATASLILDAKPDPVSSMVYGSSTSPAFVNTQLDIMRSDRVAQRVVRNLKLVDMADLRKDWESSGSGSVSFESWIVDRIQRGFDVSVARAGGGVVNISYSGTEPRFCAAVANAYVQAYMETSIELKIDPAKQYTSFFNEQADEARQTLEKAQSRLSKFQQEKGILATDERMDVEMTRLNMLSSELVSVQTQKTDVSSRQGQLAKNLDSLPEVQGNTGVASLRGELGRAEQRLAELSSRLGDNHPQVQEARASVTDLRARLQSETAKVAKGLGVNVNIQSAREAEVRAAVEAQRTRVLQLKEVRDEGAVLARDVDNAQRMYDLVFNRARQTDLESQNRQTNATVLSAALPPNQPVSKTMKYITMGVVGGLALGVLAALLVEQFDRRLRTPTDAINALGLPVIGIMPRPTAGRRWRGFLALNQQRVISGRRLLGSPKD